MGTLSRLVKALVHIGACIDRIGIALTRIMPLVSGLCRPIALTHPSLFAPRERTHVSSYLTPPAHTSPSSPHPGETWNVLKIGYQLKQVRERLAKGLVDKGVLRTEKRNFLLFDMATHPVADVRTKDALVTRVVSLLTATTSTVPATALDRDEQVQMRTMRSVCLVCAAYAASVLDNAFGRLGYEEREAAFARCDDILAEFAVWPFGATGSGSGSGPAGAGGPTAAGVPGATPRRRAENGSRIGMGGVGNGREAVLGLMQEVRKEMSGGDEDLGGELVAAVLEVLSKLDSLL